MGTIDDQSHLEDRIAALMRILSTTTDEKAAFMMEERLAELRLRIQQLTAGER